MDQLLKLKRDLTKAFGENSVTLASEIKKFDVVSTGSLALDYITGIGGFPTNRIVELGGPPGGGKTTLALIAMKNFLDRYPEKGCAIIDMEHRLTSPWLESLIGPEYVERVIVVSPDSAEDSTDVYTEIAKSDAVSMIIYDSVGSAPSQRVTNKSATIGSIGGSSLAITRLSQFASILSDKHDICTVFINQERSDMEGYNRYITPGGHGLKHACSLRIRVRPGKEKLIEKINGEDIQIGYSVRAQIVKNSLSAPHRECYYIFHNVKTDRGFGIDTLEETTRLGILLNCIEEKGKGWFYHPALPFDSSGEGKVHGQAALMRAVRDNDHTREVIIAEIRNKLNAGEGAGVASGFDPDDMDQESEEPGFFHSFDEELDDSISADHAEDSTPLVSGTTVTKENV